MPTEYFVVGFNSHNLPVSERRYIATSPDEACLLAEREDAGITNVNDHYEARIVDYPHERTT